METTPKLLKIGTGLSYLRKRLCASNHLLNTQTGTRLNALLRMRGAPSLLKNADHSESVLLSSETQRLRLCPLNSLSSIPMLSSLLLFGTTPSCSLADVRDSEPPTPTRVTNASRRPHASSKCHVNALGSNCNYITIPYDIHDLPARFGSSSPTQCWR